MANVCLPVVVSARRVEGALMLTPGNSSAVLTLLNWRCTEDSCTLKDTAVPKLAVKMRLPFAPTKIRSAAHGAVTPTSACAPDPCDGHHHTACFDIALGYADFIVFE
jgi:hypothetical protein